VTDEPRDDEGIDAGTAKIVLGILCGFQGAAALVDLAIAPSTQAGAFAVVAG
jgi:hypothetical protein